MNPPQPLWDHPGGVTRGPTAASWGGTRPVGEPLLTAGFADAVDGWHPEVGGACVEYHGEVLGGGPNGDLPKILHLAESGAVSLRHGKKSWQRGACARVSAEDRWGSVQGMAGTGAAFDLSWPHRAR